MPGDHNAMLRGSPRIAASLLRHVEGSAVSTSGCLGASWVLSAGLPYLQQQQQEDGPSTSCTSFVQHRWATKKAGGNANQAVGSKPKNLGVKITAGELVFPGMIIARQRGTKFHPGYNVDIGKDHTIFATAPGFVRFDIEKTTFGTERRIISVEPVNGDWTDKYKELAAELVARRAEIKRSKLQSVPLEPALHFPLNVQADGRLSWRGPAQAPVPAALVAAAAKAAVASSLTGKAQAKPAGKPKAKPAAAAAAQAPPPPS